MRGSTIWWFWTNVQSIAYIHRHAPHSFFFTVPCRADSLIWSVIGRLMNLFFGNAVEKLGMGYIEARCLPHVTFSSRALVLFNLQQVWGSQRIRTCGTMWGQLSWLTPLHVCVCTKKGSYLKFLELCSFAKLINVIVQYRNILEACWKGLRKPKLVRLL